MKTLYVSAWFNVKMENKLIFALFAFQSIIKYCELISNKRPLPFRQRFFLQNSFFLPFSPQFDACFYDAL